MLEQSGDLCSSMLCSCATLGRSGEIGRVILGAGNARREMQTITATEVEGRVAVSCSGGAGGGGGWACSGYRSCVSEQPHFFSCFAVGGLRTR